MKEREKRTVLLPAELYGKIEERVKATDFGSVDEYVEFVMEEVVKEEEEGKAFSEEEEKEVKKRLKDLGYLE
jgi:Arc/MetJ-type ribon-helix-helix transcriptional regulator